MVTKYTQWLDLAYLNRVQSLADKGICRKQGLHSRPQKKYFDQQELDGKKSMSVAIWWIKLCNQEHIGSSVQRAVDVLKAFTLSLAAQYIIKKTSIYCPKKGDQNFCPTICQERTSLSNRTLPCPDPWLATERPWGTKLILFNRLRKLSSTLSIGKMGSKIEVCLL